MHAPSTRIVYRFQPYIAALDEAGNIERAYGPFVVGSEPSLESCTEENEVRDPGLVQKLRDLAPFSPSVPGTRDTLAGG